MAEVELIHKIRVRPTGFMDCPYDEQTGSNPDDRLFGRHLGSSISIKPKRTVDARLEFAKNDFVRCNTP